MAGLRGFPADAVVCIAGSFLHIVDGGVCALAVFHVPENAGGGGAQNGSCDDDLVHDSCFWFMQIQTMGVPEIPKEF
jgi:hypothetical protein